jgi:alpha-L-glutamate ligase-like protein
MPTKPSHILGMNARYQYTVLNSAASKKYGFSKLRTKELLTTKKLPVAQLYHIFNTMDQARGLFWDTVPVPFVIKPANGSAGKGVLVITKKAQPGQWVSSDGEKYSTEDLLLHVGNILDGEFSTWGRNHQAILEEMIPVHPKLAKYTYKGTPDIRVIVFNSIPVMAMLRLPTKESKGRANLDKGALALGIDIATGITTFGIRGKGERITHLPDSKKKVSGIQVPFWPKVLETAVLGAQAAGYQFMGADLFIHPEQGPMIVELNGFPGLSIQLANRAGLKRRIERVEGLEVRDAKHGVKIGQALFAETFPDRLKAEEGLQVISTHPTVTVLGDNRKNHHTQALVNTGRHRSIISEAFAEQLGLVDLEDLLWRQQEGIEGKLPVVEVKFRLKNRLVSTGMLVSKRLNKTSYKVELGRHDIEGFLIGEIVS